jgi:hypothetical protein
MALFHLCQINPNSRIHVIAGYDEVAETVLWGLRNLGHAASYAVNRIRPEAINIILGAHNMGLDYLQTLGKNTIIYNLEQMHGLYGEALKEDNLIRIRELYDWAGANLTVWDYSQKNIDGLKSANPAANAYHVPIAYAPALERIKPADEQDIDILFIGMPHEYRLDIYRELCERWLSSIFVCGLYGESRDGLIARSKLVMNISAGVDNSVFSVVRSSYFLANRKAVVADLFLNMHIEADMREAVRFVHREQLAVTCAQLLGDETERKALEERGYEIFRRRDIRRILMTALSAAAARA